MPAPTNLSANRDYTTEELDGLGIDHKRFGPSREIYSPHHGYLITGYRGSEVMAWYIFKEEEASQRRRQAG